MMRWQIPPGRAVLRFLIAAGVALLLPLAPFSRPVTAQEVEVDLELVLAVDVSRSMDYGEQDLQRDGYVAAFRHPEVLAAIVSGPLGRIAVTYVEWAGPFHQAVIVPWTILTDPEDAAAFADRLAEAPITRERWTSISSALAHASRSFELSGANGIRRTVDVSGDGPNNMGAPVPDVRDTLVNDGVTINGMPILLQPATYSAFTIPDLDVYYEKCVIGGPGAFMIAVMDVEDLQAAIRRKLVLEIAGLPPRLMNAADGLGGKKTESDFDCLIGEKLWLRWFGR